MTPALKGIFLTAEKPEETARFYREVLRLELEQIGNTGGYVYWKMDAGGVQLAIHDAKQFSDYTHPACRESNLTHLYFKIENQAPLLQRLEALGITPHAIDDIVVTVEDPDGRKVMLGTA
jgi:predicted enzyme related to lactoylglutathione lyase